jgi:hypothetical protein
MKTAILLLAIAAAGTAFAAEPAQCADRAVTETVRELFWENKLRLPLPKPHETIALKAYNDWPVSAVTSNGYDATLKRRLCEASLGAGQRPLRVWYSAQLTDAGSTFVRADFSAFPDAHAMVLRELIVQLVNAKP